MSYLLDTNILSEGAPKKDDASTFAELAEWLDRAGNHIWLSVITLAEIEAGIERSSIKGERRKVMRLRAWLNAIEHLYGDRILPLDRETARLAGVLSARAHMNGASAGFADAAIAATAIRHDLSLMTRNAKDFAPMGISFINPYDDGLPLIPERPES